MEVIARRTSKSLAISCTIAALTAWLFLFLFNEQPLLPYSITTWNNHAIPYFIILSLLSGLLAVYFTLWVTRMKTLFSKITNNFLKVTIGAILVGLMIYYFPSLYGDSYHGLKEILQQSINMESISILFLLFLLLLKPIAASLTLGAGGDGGVFAPSIVAGAFLGLFFASFCNTYFGANLIPLNFAMVGAAATLSASLFAPFTSLVLISSLLPNGIILFLPLIVGCFISQMISKKILPYNVYTYDFYLESKLLGKNNR